MAQLKARTAASAVGPKISESLGMFLLNSFELAR